jgi:hypothetical protein
MKRTRKILNIIALVLAVLQVLGYVGYLNSKPEEEEAGVNAVFFYIGFNLPIIIAAILFVSSLILKRKIDKKEADIEIDSIGKY